MAKVIKLTFDKSEKNRIIEYTKVLVNSEVSFYFRVTDVDLKLFSFFPED